MPNHIPKTRTIEAEIFSTGTWNGETFDRADLEEIAGNFHRLKASLNPPLKFGHDEDQTLLGQMDGDPALGWVEDLRVEGDKLVAKFAGVPDVVHEAIREGRYRRISAELYFNVRHEGQEIGKVLKAVALLGADLPAVTNLEDLSAYLATAENGELGTNVARCFTLTAHGGRISAPTRPEGEGAATALEAELAELRVYKARQERRRNEEAFHAARRDAASVCDNAVMTGKIPPHLKERLLGEIDAQIRTFTEQTQLNVSFDWLRAFINETPAQLPHGELAVSRQDADLQSETDDPSLSLARLASAKMIELNLNYGRAAAYVLETNPHLARSYRDYTLKANTGG